jgi:hypothetical protein
MSNDVSFSENIVIDGVDLISLRTSSVLIAIDQTHKLGIDACVKLFNAERPSQEQDERIYEELKYFELDLSKELIEKIGASFLKSIVRAVENKELKTTTLRRYLSGEINCDQTTVSLDDLDAYYTLMNLEQGDCYYRLAMYVNELLGFASQNIAPSQISVTSFILNLPKVDQNDLELLNFNEDLENYQRFQDDEERAEIYELFKQIRFPTLYKKSSSNQSNGKEHGNKIRFSQSREEILGAALAVVTQFPELCKNKRGSIEASKVAKVIEQKAGLFWEDYEPPLSLRATEELIRKWLRKVK